MKNKVFLVLLALVLVALPLFAACAAPAPTAAPYFKGKTITIICPFSPGGTYDRMSRLVAEFMPKHIPGEPTIIVQNMTGGGGMIAMRTAYNAKPDGTTLIHFPSTYAFQALLGEGTDIDFTKWGWLGSVAGAHYVLIIRSELPYRSVEELRTAPEPIKLGILGPGSSITETAKILKLLGGLNVKLVPGYAGYAKIALAVRQKEVDGATIPFVTFIANPLTKEMIEEGFVTPVLGFGGGKVPEQFASIAEKLPYLRDHIADETDRGAFDAYIGTFKITRPFMTTPGVPAEPLKILRDGLWKMMHDPEYITTAEEQGFALYPVDHEETTSVIKSMFELPKPVEDRLKEVFK